MLWLFFVSFLESLLRQENNPNDREQVWRTQSDSYCGRKRGMSTNLTKMPDVTMRHERIFIGLCEMSWPNGEED